MRRLGRQQDILCAGNAGVRYITGVKTDLDARGSTEFSYSDIDPSSFADSGGNQTACAADSGLFLSACSCGGMVEAVCGIVIAAMPRAVERIIQPADCQFYAEPNQLRQESVWTLFFRLFLGFCVYLQTCFLDDQ